jgi:hypothetical protein
MVADKMRSKLEYISSIQITTKNQAVNQTILSIIGNTNKSAIEKGIFKQNKTRIIEINHEVNIQ